MLGLDGAVAEPEGVKVGHRCGQGGAEAGDYRSRLSTQRAEVAAGHGPQQQGRGWVGPLGAHQLHDPGMSCQAEYAGFLVESPALVSGGGQLAGESGLVGYNMHHH